MCAREGHLDFGPEVQVPKRALFHRLCDRINRRYNLLNEDLQD